MSWLNYQSNMAVFGLCVFSEKKGYAHSVETKLNATIDLGVSYRSYDSH